MYTSRTSICTLKRSNWLCIIFIYMSVARLYCPWLQITPLTFSNHPRIAAANRYTQINVEHEALLLYCRPAFPFPGGGYLWLLEALFNGTIENWTLRSWFTARVLDLTARNSGAYWFGIMESNLCALLAYRMFVSHQYDVVKKGKCNFGIHQMKCFH